MAQRYIVKSCLSGDTLILRGRPTPGQPPKERVAHIAEITAPRLGSSQRDDEPFAFESREYLRALTVGKEITFESTYSVPSNDGVPRDVGIATLNGQDLTNEILKNGWAKLKENKREATDEDIQRRAIEADAKANSRGIWNADGLVAKAFVEVRLLQRPVTVTLLSVPPPPAASFGSSSDTAPAATTFIGTCIHAQGGNIAEHLAGSGLAKALEWHAGMLSDHGGLEKVKAAERGAKEKRLNLHSTAAQPSNGSQKAAGTPAGPSQRTEFEGQVIRIWSSDQVSIWDDVAGKDRRVQLSSVRGPRGNDPKQAGYAAEAKEFLRKKLIGKNVTVKVDFVRPPEGEYESRECATITLPGQKTSVAEQLIEKGLATAVRHRRDDENRSPDYDKLIAAEQAAASASKGLHSGKDIALPRIVNVSETHSKASQFLPSYKRAGKIPAVVDYVAAGSRFKLLFTRDNQNITFVLSGIRAPRTARAGEKPEPCGEESSQFSTRRYLQRDVEVHIEAVDKTGGFIGTLYLTKPDKTVENAAVALTKEGLAYVHHHSAESLPWSKQLFDAETEAKEAKRGVWKNYVEEAEVEVVEQDAGALKTQYLDVIISDVRTAPQFGFSVQTLNSEGIANLEKLMREFSLHHRGAIKSPPSFSPKPGDLVSARFSADNSWYRGKIRKIVGKAEYDVVFIDYGNQETVSLANIRPLDEKFRGLAGQAQDARLSFVKLLDASSDYFDDAIDRFRSICEGRKLIANIDAREGPVLHLRLIDPSDAGSPTDSINTQLVREGLAVIDRKGCKYLSSYAQIYKRLQDDTAEAKKSRSGMYEFGDISPEDD
ncbi:hypothetical protein FRB90_001602 [Tulasnella sp. 427]|nr:hypothetical protein FRB90_001602 [Tulasnella sp. 427]